MNSGAAPPRLLGDHGLITVEESILWENALSSKILDRMPPMPRWKREEQVEPLNATIALLVAGGLSDPAEIENRILGDGERRNNDASRK
jgi:hypothetical protein